MNPAQVQLRNAEAADLDAIVELEHTTEFAPHWPRAAYAAILDSTGQQRCLIVALVGGALAGYAVGLMQPTADHAAELESVVVGADLRREGIGRSLCSAMVDWYRSQNAMEVVLEVRAGSVGAIALYAGLGFVQTGRRPRYYREPEEDAVLMRLQLI